MGFIVRLFIIVFAFSTLALSSSPLSAVDAEALTVQQSTPQASSKIRWAVAFTTYGSLMTYGALVTAGILPGDGLDKFMAASAVGTSMIVPPLLQIWGQRNPVVSNIDQNSPYFLQRHPAFHKFLRSPEMLTVSSIAIYGGAGVCLSFLHALGFPLR